MVQHSYIRSLTNGHQYLLLSHTIPSEFHRSSILDITDPTATGAYWSNITAGALAVEYTTAGLNITYPGGGYAFESLTNDSFSVLHTRQIDPTLSFDITFHTSSPIILNGGLGSLTLGVTKGQMPNMTTEWSMPSGVTFGSFHWNGTTHEIDTANSFTWYDRQWGGDVPKNWTWFGLHVGSPNDERKTTKVSLWAIDQTDNLLPRTQFATIRKEDGSQLVVPVV
ncbi:hypothetical protein DACRYDRAFT_107088 [Dacryopinax primogenitus]|uniref:AttH domain-containing protein n=1 Tax=Dacryopinax primogenitus (strain DJM 731) TaxID=1858805 RepID=M5GD65_DACPD|nr:uncharacterized protein DACRYDRAFT_107088 [Dacryopinax primogenitus]EJU02153.1 hypothetical protein DACRYDRAFT_107088 [Dacryopinax primogenitus]